MSRRLFNSMKVATVLVGVGLLAGCAPWPPYGVGGLAENHAPQWHGQSINTDTARLIAIKERIDMLSRLGGEKFHPAAMEEIRLAYLKAARAHGGKMHLDTDAYLNELEAELEFQVRRLANTPTAFPETPKSVCSL